MNLLDILSTIRLRCGYIINGYSDAKLEAEEIQRLVDKATPGSTYLTLAIDALNMVKAWRDDDGNDGFPHELREKIDALLIAYELRRAEPISPTSTTR